MAIRGGEGYSGCGHGPHQRFWLLMAIQEVIQSNLSVCVPDRYMVLATLFVMSDVPAAEPLSDTYGATQPGQGYIRK